MRSACSSAGGRDCGFPNPPRSLEVPASSETGSRLTEFDLRTRLYDIPEIYDIAFVWDLSQEISFFKRVFETYVPFPVRDVLEPACGTGRFLRTLPTHGFQVTGYDINPTMLQYAEDSIAAANCEESVRALLANMISAEVPGEFDAALNSINSIGYLHSDEDVVSHLKATGSSLREGGIYIVHLNFAHEGKLPGGDRWTMERDGISVETWWRVIREDREAKLSHQICSFKVERDGRIERFDDRHTLRLWLFSDLEDLVRRSGQFEIAAIYGEDLDELNDIKQLTGELGNVYVILQKVDATKLTLSRRSMATLDQPLHPRSRQRRTARLSFTWSTHGRRPG